MTTKPSLVDVDFSGIWLMLWVWAILSAIGTGVWFGYLFAKPATFSDEMEFNAGAFVGGTLAGFASTAPLWVMALIGHKIVTNIYNSRIEQFGAHSLTKSEMEGIRQHMEAVAARASASTVAIDAPTLTPKSTPRPEAPASKEPAEAAARLLADPIIAAQVRTKREADGDWAAAAFLGRLARERGYDGQALREWHLPADL